MSGAISANPKKQYVIIISVLFLFLYPSFLEQTFFQYLRIPSVDLPSFWCTAKAAFHHRVSAYDPKSLQDLLPSQIVYPCLNPPPFLLVTYPLSLFSSYETAKAAVLVLNHLLLLFLVWFVPIKLLGISVQKAPLIFAVCMVYMVTFQPLALTLRHGQVNLLLACSLYAFWFFARRHRHIPAALLLVCAIILKTYPVLMLLFLMVCKEYRICIYSVLLLCILSLISVWVLPPGTWSDWFHTVLPSGGYAETPVGLFPPSDTANQSLNGFFSRIFSTGASVHPPVSPFFVKTVTYTASLTILAASVYAVYRKSSRHPAASFDWAMFIFFPVMYLVAPLSWEHHLVYLIATILASVMVSAGEEPFHFKCISLIVIVSALVIGAPGLLHYKFFAVFALWSVILMTALTDKRDSLVPLS